MKIALDAMGGDHAPASTVAGALQALEAYPDIELILVGDEERLKQELAKLKSPWPMERLTLHPASQVIAMSDNPMDAVRKKKDSSISRAIELISDGQADAVVSAGHTGAMVAASYFRLKTLPGIDRPAIAALMPNGSGFFLLIDAGANVDSEPKHLLQFAIMGSIYSRKVLHIENPRVGIMSIGSEPGKGNDLTKAAYEELSKAKINFIGNVEGHDLFQKGSVDVVVCDGFVGNIILKTSESLAKSIFGWLREELYRSTLRKIGAYLAKSAFMAIRARTNTEEYGGMPLLGINGICIKAHGNSSPKAIKNAIRVARETITQQVNPHIIKSISLT